MFDKIYALVFLMVSSLFLIKQVPAKLKIEIIIVLKSQFFELIFFCALVLQTLKRNADLISQLMKGN